MRAASTFMSACAFSSVTPGLSFAKMLKSSPPRFARAVSSSGSGSRRSTFWMPFTAGMISLLNTKSDAITPTIVNVFPLSVRLLPTTDGSEPNRRFQKPLLRMTDRRFARLVLVGREHAPGRGLGAEERKERRRHARAVDALGHAAPGEVEARADRRGDVGEDLVVGS